MDYFVLACGLTFQQYTLRFVTKGPEALDFGQYFQKSVVYISNSDSVRMQGFGLARTALILNDSYLIKWKVMNRLHLFCPAGQWKRIPLVR